MRVSLLLAATMMAAQLMSAQTIVLPGDGTLAAALLAAQPGDVLQLQGGAEYTHSASAVIATINKTVTIQVAPGTSARAIIRLADNAPASRKYFFFMIMDGAKLTLKGLDIHGLLGGVPVAMSMIKFDGSPVPTLSKIGTMRLEDCVFHDFVDNIVHGMTEATCTGLIQDSLFIHNVIVYNASAFLQYKHVSLRHLELTNSTVYRLEGMALKIGKEFNYRQTKITPTGFIDHCTFDDMGGPIHGHIQVDNAYFPLTISNSIISNQDVIVNQPAVLFLEPRIDTAVIIRSTCFWNTGPQNADTGPSWQGYVFSDSVTADPLYLDAAHGNFTLSSDSPLLTLGTDGGPIGDPRWVSPTSTDLGVLHNSTPRECRLLPNYPNPFNPTTTICYRLAAPPVLNTADDFPFRGSAAHMVRLAVYDIVGHEVALLVNECQSPGVYSVVFNAAHLASGGYVVQLSTDGFAESRTLLLLR